VKGEEKPREGCVNDFKPTPEIPDIVSYTTRRLIKKNEGLVVDRIEIKESKVEVGARSGRGFLQALPLIDQTSSGANRDASPIRPFCTKYGQLLMWV
jgi:hypothetical protein